MCYSPANMPVRQLPGTDVRLRRGRRDDLDGVQALLPDGIEARRSRFDRRTLSGLGQDVYVAERPGGELVGVVAVAYLRSLRSGRFPAVLDTARIHATPGGPLLDHLIAFAEERARRRGCRQVRAWVDPDDDTLRAALLSRGWQVAGTLEAALEIAR